MYPIDVSDALVAGAIIHDDSLCQRVCAEWGGDEPGVLVTVEAV